MLIYFILLFFNVILSVTSQDKLIHVHALWRHGERNPRKLFHGDLNNDSAFPEGLGQLTKNGINQLYTIGKHFQARYMYEFQFLTPEYLHSEVYARSTDIDRTIISAMAFYSGLYSNGTNEAHILAPVPIHTMQPKMIFFSNKTQIPLSYYHAIFVFDATTIEVSALRSIGFIRFMKSELDG
uniref:Uncharacterized protein n=1 Tax=Panagrolaimus sp. ES5 TaxID=591445 RepID=A0AC34FMQ3_9BILA